MAKPEFYSASWGIIRNDKGEVLYMRRANSGFRDGEFQLPSGHLEGTETMKECLIREMKEELDIDILESDLEIKHISHRTSTGERVYFDIYIEVNKYTGTPIIAEKEKCSELKYVDINNIPENEKHLFSFDIDVINMIENGESFSDISIDSL